METLGDRLKYLRTSMGLTQLDMSEKTGISRSNISRIEKNEISPSSNVIVQICTSFDVSFAWLLTGEGEMRKEASVPAEEPVQKLSMDEKILLNNYRDMEEEEKEKIQKHAARLLSIDKTKNILASPNSTSGEECATHEKVN